MNVSRDNRNAFLQPAFVICTAVLALAGVGMSALTRMLGVHAKKEPLPLKKPFDAIDEQKLAPYKVLARHTIQNEKIVESLGTADYVQWVLEDTREPVAGPVRRLLLFITYYDVPDRVPHVPEECYTGGGYDCLTRAQVVFTIDSIGQGRRIPGRFLLFHPPLGGHDPQAGEFPVIYLFRINEQYAGGRDDTRLALNRALFRKQSYFCKIELAFNQAAEAPTKDEAVAASERLLTALLPLLEREHWPDSE